MIDAIRSEWIKLRTVASTWALTITAVAFPVVIVAITMVAISATSARTNDTSDLVEIVVNLAVVSALLVGTTTATLTTTEFGNNTIRPTFVGLPDRWRAMVAKLVVFAVYAAIVMVVTVALAWFAGSIILNARDGSVPLGDEDAAMPALIGVVVLGILLGLLGYALGLLMRNTALAICTVLLWPLLVEGLIGALLNEISEGAEKYLPYREGFQLITLEGDSDMFSRVGGGLYFAVWVLALLVGGMLLTKRRDA